MTKHLITVFVFFLVLLNSMAQDLETKITIQAKDQPVESILESISDKYGVSFSYLNNELPRKQLSITFREVPLHEVLEGLLASSQLSFVQHGDQIIIKRADELAMEQIVEEEPQPSKTPVSPNATLTLKNEMDSINALTLALRDSIVARDSLVHMKQDTLSKKPTELAAVQQPVQEDTTTTIKTTPERVAEDSTSDTGVTITYIPGAKSMKQDQNPEDEIPVEVIKYKFYHFGAFYPFSTHGSEAGQYINNLSLHAFASYSRGLDGFEFSSLANITRYHMKGFQIAGVTNVVGDRATGVQLAGVVNNTGGKVHGAQLAGITNISRGTHAGIQAAGVSNIALDSVSGLQASMAVNVATGRVKYGQLSAGINIANKVDGPQVAGLINLQRGYFIKGNGIQVAGFMNRAGSFNGMQLAGFMNRADKINGLQAAGFINTASKVNGVQLGIINIADSLDGVPIGLFSLVKKNGYFDLELFYADDFKANAIIKVGSSRFHNIFGFSYEVDHKKRWAYGYGFGSQWGDRIVRLNTDAMAYYVVEREFPDGAFKDYELNILSKFRFLGSLHIHNFGIFGGPVFNLMVSRHRNENNERIGSDIATSPFFDHTDQSGTNVKMWMGYNVGIRF